MSNIIKQAAVDPAIVVNKSDSWSRVSGRSYHRLQLVLFWSAPHFNLHLTKEGLDTVKANAVLTHTTENRVEEAKVVEIITQVLNSR